MKIKMADNKGFTLIEIVVVVVILGVLGIFGYHFLSTSVHTYSTMEKQKGLYDEAAMAMERISRELRDAESISSPVSGSTDDTLTFKKPEYHGTPEDATLTITFQHSSGTLRREGIPLAEKVSESGFLVERGTSPAKDGITIPLTLSESTGESITLRTYIYPKNLDYSGAEDFSGRDFDGNWQEDFQ